MPSHTQIDGITSFGDAQLNRQILYNIINFYDWATLSIGAFYNVRINNSGAYGGNNSQLRLVRDPNYTNGQVWEGFRKNWVWESGVEGSNQPILISGIFINNVFAPKSGIGPNSFYIDYPNGRIIFNSAIATTSIVKSEYSYKLIHFTSADSPFFKEIQFNSFRMDDEHFLQQSSGIWHTLAQNRIQLPAVFIEVLPSRSFKGYQLGQGQYVYQDVGFHIFTETSFDRDNLIDIITYKNDKTLYLYNSNTAPFPLDHRGSVVNNAKVYKDLVKETDSGGYRWRTCNFENMTATQIYNSWPLYNASIKTTLNVEMWDL